MACAEKLQAPTAAARSGCYTFSVYRWSAPLWRSRCGLASVASSASPGRETRRGRQFPASRGAEVSHDGLPFSTTSESLRRHFAQSGTVVSADVVTDRVSGESRGFGFVQMSTDAEANAAIT